MTSREEGPFGGFTVVLSKDRLTVATDDGGGRHFDLADFLYEDDLRIAITQFLQINAQGFVDDALESICEDDDYPFDEVGNRIEDDKQEGP